MKILATSLLACGLLWSAAPAADAADTFPYDHLHLMAPEPAKAVAWYIANLGARPGDTPDRVVIGRTIFAFITSPNAAPSAGSAIDHLGFSVADVDATTNALVAAGATLLTPPRDIPGLFRIAFVQDPFGVKHEIVADRETPGFHHIHLVVPDPDASLAFYERHFGGERTKLKGRLDAIKYANPGVWLLAQKGDGVAPSQGRAIDHLGWAIPNLSSHLASLSAAGLKPTDPRQVRHLTIAFVDGPGGVRIEMVQGRKEEELAGR